VSSTNPEKKLTHPGGEYGGTSSLKCDIQFLLVVFAVAWAAAVYFEPFSGGTNPKPRPIVPPSADSVEAKAVAAWQKQLVSCFAMASLNAQAGKTAAQVHEELKADLTRTRVESFAEVSAKIDDAIGGDRWEPTKAAKLFAEIMVEFEKLTTKDYTFE
jgi:hypothetical protein